MRKSLMMVFLFWTVWVQAETSDDSSMTYQLFGEVLFLQPNASNLYYAIEAVPQNPALADPLLEAHWFDHEISPSYHPAFIVGGEAIFEEMGMRLVFDYQRLTSTDIEHLSVENGVAMVGPLFDIGPDAEVYIQSKGKLVFHFDKADVFLQKQFYHECRWALDFLVGATFARIKQYMRTEYFSLDHEVGRVIKTPSLFIGGGLSSGFGFQFKLAKYFELTGSSVLSLLMGKMQNKTTYRSYSPTISEVGNPQPTTEPARIPDRSQLVPALEEKLGFAFDYPFACGHLSLEAGYLFQIFLNAIQTFDIDVIVTVGLPFPTADGYYAQGFQRTLSNFILSGPYFNMNVSF